MHHSLRLYSRYQPSFLKFYIIMGKWTRLPLIGWFVRKTANIYGSKVSAAYLLTTDEAVKIVEKANGLALGPCSCRRVFNNCDNPVNTEIMIGLGKHIFSRERPEDFRELSKEEAGDILKNAHKKGLIHTIVKCRTDFYAICNCCSCCCVPLRLNKKYGIGNALVRSDDIVKRITEGQLV